MNKKKIIEAALISLLAVAIVAGAAMLFTDTKSTWYLSLEKPTLQPPAIVFPIVWSVLYLLYAASLTLASINNASKKTFVLFLLQGVLNITWCLFFFTFKLPIVALLIILLYLAVGYLTIKELYPHSKWGAFLLIPLMLWLTLATVLNYLIILLN